MLSVDMAADRLVRAILPKNLDELRSIMRVIGAMRGSTDIADEVLLTAMGFVEDGCNLKLACLVALGSAECSTGTTITLIPAASPSLPN